MDQYRLTIEVNPRSRDAQTIIESLYKYNRIETQTKAEDIKRLAVFLRDSRNHIAGGLLAWAFWGWLQIEFLWIRDDLRGMGFGNDLMIAAEEKALAMGCYQAYLETFSFQNTDFYKKLGYEVFGILEDYPRNHNKYFLRKRLR